MHPIEHLRYVARAGDADPTMLAEEAAEALGSLAREPRALVPACRRLIDFHPTCGPLWWVCARLLVAEDAWEAARHAIEELSDDPTADELAATFPAGATIACSASDLLTAALSERPDLTGRVVGAPNALRSVLRRAAGGDVTGWDTSELDEALEGVDVVVLDALAVGPTGYLVDRDSALLAAAAASSNTVIWVAVATGRLLPGPLYDALLQRQEVLAEPDEDDDDLFAAGGARSRRASGPLGRARRRGVPLDATTALAIVGPDGAAVPAVGLRRASCPAPAELLVPARLP